MVSFKGMIFLLPSIKVADFGQTLITIIVHMQIQREIEREFSAAVKMDK